MLGTDTFPDSIPSQGINHPWYIDTKVLEFYFFNKNLIIVEIKHDTRLIITNVIKYLFPPLFLCWGVIESDGQFLQWIFAAALQTHLCN